MRILRPLGAVTEFIQSREDGLFYEVRGDYFLGELGERLADPVEPDHELHWFAPDVAVEKLHRPGHIDAVRRALGQNK
jgi:hypothetical protein